LLMKVNTKPSPPALLEREISAHQPRQRRRRLANTRRELPLTRQAKILNHYTPTGTFKGGKRREDNVKQRKKGLRGGKVAQIEKRG